MRRYLILLVPLLALACDREAVAPDPDTIIAPAFSATSEWTEETTPMDWSYYFPCVEEELHWTGPVTYRDHWITKPDGSVSVNGKADYYESQFYGEASGIWLPVAGTHNNYKGAWIGSSDWVVNERITIENQETGVLMDIDTKIHIVVTGKGAKVVTWQFAACSLRDN
ncbi:MAG: hypothetical protein PVJ64_12575 [Gemmatimonadales bacterium]|jgi:hypothetical protein